MYDDPHPSIPLVRLIGGLSLHYGGRRMALPPGSHRLLAYLALHPGGVDRRSAAGALWPTDDDDHASGNLRSALWRLQQVGCPLVRADGSTLGLREGVEVDLARFEAWAGRILAGTAGPDDVAVDPAPIADLELLPGWSDDWVRAEREPLHLRRVRALEELGRLRPAVRAVPPHEGGRPTLTETQQVPSRTAARRQFGAFRRILHPAVQHAGG